MKTKLPERVLPPVWKNVIEFGFVRRLTWKERIQIAVGYNLTISFRALAQHTPGQMQPSLRVATTKHVSATDMISQG